MKKQSLKKSILAVANMLEIKSVKKQNLTYVIILFLCAVMTAMNVSMARNDANYTLFDPLVDVVDLLKKHYVSETDESELITGAINGMLHELDPYSEYIPAKDLEEFSKQTSGSYEGIGIGIDVRNNHLIVISPFEDSPAYKAGVLPGDIIIEVDGNSTKGWSSTRAVKKLTGPAGTKVTIKLIRRDGTEKTVVITRRRIHVPTVRGWRRNTIDGSWDYMIDSESRTGYIRVTQFVEDTIPELDRAVASLREQDMQALILDLRSNPGGLMTTATAMVDRLIDHGVIVSTRGAHNPARVTEAQPLGTYPHFHLSVLIDQGSASASEIVAGALQDHGRAVIVGKRSWGKGSVQRIISLSDSGAAVKLTTDHYYLPSGRCVHRLPGSETWGVTPDVDEDIDLSSISKMRDLMDELIFKPLATVGARANNNGKSEDRKEDTTSSPETQSTEQAEKTTQQQDKDADLQLKEQLSDKLLGLDNQLAQALKQCKGLIRTRPTLPALAETFTETQTKP